MEMIKEKRRTSDSYVTNKLKIDKADKAVLRYYVESAIITALPRVLNLVVGVELFCQIYTRELWLFFWDAILVVRNHHLCYEHTC